MTLTEIPQRPEDGLPHWENLVEALLAELVDRETEYATLNLAFAAFRTRFLSRIALLYAELDGVLSKIAEAQSAREGTQESVADAEAAAARAEASRAAAEDAAATTSSEWSDIDPEFKDLYRRAAKTFHPDLATNEEARRYRTAIMARVNAAYAAGDAEAIHQILDDEGEIVEQRGPGQHAARLRTLQRQAVKIRARLRELAAATAELEADPIFHFFREAEDDGDAAEVSLDALEADIRTRISDAKRRLRRVRR